MSAVIFVFLTLFVLLIFMAITVESNSYIFAPLTCLISNVISVAIVMRMNDGDLDSKMLLWGSTILVLSIPLCYITLRVIKRIEKEAVVKVKE